MPTEDGATAAAVEADPTGSVTQEPSTGEQQEQPSGDGQVTPDNKTEADPYDAAFDQFLGPDAKPQPDATEQQAAAGGEDNGKGELEASGKTEHEAEATTPELTDDQKHLLQRMHLSTEQIAGWTDEQREAFFAKNQEREAGQTTSYKDLSEEVKRLAALVQGKGAGKPGDGDGDGEGEGGEGGTVTVTPDGDSFEARASEAVKKGVEVYGPEFGDFGESYVALARSTDQLQQQLGDSESARSQTSGLLVELIIDSGIRDLEGEFPTLSKADARQKVHERFKADWQNSPHRTGDDSQLVRVRRALSDAAKAEFSNTNESAAQVALANKTKQRLKQQPDPGHGRGRTKPKSEDDVYDDAFEKHLAKNKP